MEVNGSHKRSEIDGISRGWKAESLGNVAEVIMGQSPPGNSYNQTGIGTPLINGPTEFTDKYPIKIQWTTDATKFCKEGDLLLCVRGSSTGRINISNGEYCIGRGVAAIRARSGADTTFITYQVSSAIQKLLGLSAGSTFPNVDGKSIRSITILLPQYEEQRAIATALSDVDALINSLDRLIAKKRDLKQAAMQELLTGKRRLPGFSGEWEETTLGQIGECIIGLTYKPENVVEHGLLVLRSSNVQSGRLAYADNVYVNIVVPENLITRPGDILICVRNGSRALIGKCARIDEAAAGLTFGAFMSIYRTKHSQYIFHAFQANNIQRQIHENIGATINQITNKDLNAFRVKLPPDDEQEAISTVLSDMDAEIVALEQKRDKTIALKQGMMQELLTGRIRLPVRDSVGEGKMQ